MNTVPRSKHAVAAWCSYDFAGSIYTAVVASTIWPVFYTTTVVGNADGRGDFWWGTVSVNIAAILVAITAPAAGAIADLAGARRLLWVSYTLVAVAGTAMLGFVGPGDVVLGCVLFIVAHFAAEGAINFYNAYLPELVPRERVGRVSGWGFATGYVGSLAGLGLAFTLNATGHFRWIFPVTAAAFLGFAIPSFILVGRGGVRRMPVAAAARHGLRHLRQVLGEVLRIPDLRRFLLGYFLYINGVNAAIAFAAAFAATTFGLTTQQAILLFVLVQISALVGAFVMAKPTDILGSKRVVQISLGLWILTVAVLVLTRDIRLFWIGCTIAGLGLGSVQAASRSFMATLVPAGREDEMFGFYALCGKSSTPLGAAAWGIVSATTGSQRLAVLSLLPFFIAGFIVVSLVRGGGPAARAPEPAA